MTTSRFEIDFHTRIKQQRESKQTAVYRLFGKKQYLILDKKQMQTAIEQQKLWFKNYYGAYLSSLLLDDLVNDWVRSNVSRYRATVWLTPKQATLLSLQDYEVKDL
jgi:hypothetical protein